MSTSTILQGKYRHFLPGNSAAMRILIFERYIDEIPKSGGITLTQLSNRLAEWAILFSQINSK